MKKVYYKPQLTAVEVEFESAILQSSGVQPWMKDIPVNPIINS